MDFQARDREHITRFLESDANRPTLGLVYGRRRIGKSTLLEQLTADRAGFYWEATRTESAVQLQRLGAALGEHLDVGRVALGTWEEAVEQMLRLPAGSALPVVLDEFGYVLEADASVPSIIAAAIGPGGRRRNPGRARLILCGSAIAMMRALSSGEAPLRGRAGMELVMQPAGYRDAARWLGRDVDLRLAARVYAVIGGVVGYATDMVDHDLPSRAQDFERWVAARVLSPAATLHHEATTLLAEDPTLSAASPPLHHAILGAIANGSVTAGTIAGRLRRQVSNLDPPLKRLISAGFVVRHVDPIRDQRPTYALADPFLQFHYAILEPHASLLRDRDPSRTWRAQLAASFDSRVRGPVFEEQARTWVRRHASASTLGGTPTYVGPSTVTIGGKECQMDVVATSAAEDAPPSQRNVFAIGEAKAGQTLTLQHLERLEQARAALGARASAAKLLLFASDFDKRLTTAAAKRHDVELVDLPRLYDGD